MTATPSLPAQIAPTTQQIIDAFEEPQDGHELAQKLEQCWPIIKRALQQHERLEAASREVMTSWDHCLMQAAKDFPDDPERGGFDRDRDVYEKWDALRAALGTAAPGAVTDAVEPAITPEMLRAGISVAEAHFLRAHGAWRDLVVAVYRAMHLSRPSPSGETEATLSREDIAENSGGRP